METFSSPHRDAPASVFRDRALGIIATATLLALLYFARDVLVPITLAFILSLLVAPLVKFLRRIGLGQTFSVLMAVLVLALSVGAVAAVIGSREHLARIMRGFDRGDCRFPAFHQRDTSLAPLSIDSRKFARR